MPDRRPIRVAIPAGFNVCTGPRYSLLVHPTSDSISAPLQTRSSSRAVGISGRTLAANCGKIN